MVPLAAFLRAGRFMVTVTTPSLRSTIRVSSPVAMAAAYEVTVPAPEAQKASSMTSTSPAVIDTTSKRTSTRVRLTPG